ncbi:hypothetical protein FRC0484_00556 [Corynebacterium diphtheriae]|uniref:thioesterase family protein n=1 Tax=Corynebacterium TaxID=1716 RepID=UPI0006827531|nr:MULTISPECIES: hypothetical protein [Corynebacterium]MBG9256633.1 hypothetical protein [Corynebacterium diphtheriae bv. mitis]MBG9319577.1 hypothetical protein [Corynebacterium belfantii]MBG9331101.1 hypothetical protein [Corynebacterium belfantii]OJH94495.1 hypothetical protein BKD74_04865 [Corynebacterium diphtheriae]CAB0518161.1 hypothetical protein CIP100294_01679 [Corynebacterium diphtheriae]
MSTVEYSVEEKDLATNWRNDLPVVSTPVLVWLCEIAAMDELSHSLGTEIFTVGFSHECKHVGACGKGSQLKAHASLLSSEETTFSFDCSVYHNDQLLMKSIHTRKRWLRRKS